VGLSPAARAVATTGLLVVAAGLLAFTLITWMLER